MSTSNTNNKGKAIYPNTTSSFGDTVPIDVIKQLRAATGNHSIMSPTAYRDPPQNSKRPAEISPQSIAPTVGKNGSGWWDIWQRGAEPPQATEEVPHSSVQRSEKLPSQHPTIETITARANSAKTPVETAPPPNAPSARAPSIRAPSAKVGSAKIPVEKAPPVNSPSAKPPSTKVPSPKIPTNQPPTIQALTARALAEKEPSNTASKGKDRASEHKTPQNEEVINALSQVQIAEEASSTIPRNPNIDVQALAIMQRLTWECQQNQQKQSVSKPSTSSTIRTLRDTVGTSTKNGESSRKPNVPYSKSQIMEPVREPTRLPSSGLRSAFTNPEDIKMASKQLQLASLKPEERKKQDEWARKVLRATEKPCPGNYGWVRVDKTDKFWPGKSGYRCASGLHMVTDELIAEGMGGYYEGYVCVDGIDKDGNPVTRPVPGAPQSANPIYQEGDPAHVAHAQAGRDFFGIYINLVTAEGT